MKVVCDNCRAVYKVPDLKLTKAVNKATCRQCGHRMLIPKPKPGADPDERTLVTAVPPTPAGAPMRDNGPHTSPIEDEPEQTLPGRAPDDHYMGQDTHRDEVPVFPGTPLPAYDKYSLETKGAAKPNLAARSPSSVADTQVDPVGSPRKTATPAPRPRSHTPAPSQPRQDYAGTPAPAADRLDGRGADKHDPSGDLSWALLGAMAGLAGAFMLAFLSVFEDPLITRLVMWFGLAMSFGGGTLAVLVLLTGGRGRRPANTIVSVVFGFFVAVISASTLVSLQVATTILVNEINFATPNFNAIPNAVVPAPEPSLASAEPEADAQGEGEAGGSEDDAVADAAVDPEEPEEEPEAAEPPAVAAAAAPKPAPKSATSAAPAPSPSPASAPAPRPAPAAAPKPAPAPAPAKDVSTVPLEVVHVMLSNNLEVKKCFVPLFKAGQLPPRVDVRMTILPTGQATGIAITQPQFAGSELDRCLGSAIASITFPPSGAGAKFTYPFVLQ